MADAQTPVLTDEPFGYWHQGATYDESDFHLASESGDVSCENCVKLYTHPAPSQPARAVMQQALDAIAPRFRSGNAVPVEKAMVPAAEWHALVAALEKYLAS